MPATTIHPLNTLVPEEYWPSDVFADLGGGLLTELGYTDVRVVHEASGLLGELQLAIKGEVELSIPGVDAVTLVIGAGISGWTTIPIRARLGAASSVSIENLPIALRFSRDILTPTDPNRTHAEITFAATVRIDAALNVTIEAGQSLSLPECEIAGSGVRIEASDITWNFSRGKSLPTAQAAGIDGEFLGVAFRQAVLTLPPGLAGTQLTFDYACIGTGGFTGGVAADFSQSGDPLPNIQIGGFQIDLARVAIRFQESRLVMGEIEAVLKDLPLFETDVAVDIQLGVGGLRIALSAADDRLGGANSRSADGLITLRKPDLIAMTISSAEIEIAGGVATLRLGGRVVPELTLPGDVRLPAFEVEALSISSDGRVGLSGGLIDLPESTRVTLAGFGLELTQVGLGSEADGSRWVAFSGSLSLTEGMPITAAVDGLKVRWNRDGPLGIELAGIALAFEIEGVLRFSGSISYTKAELDNAGRVVQPARFEGAGSVELVALNLTVSARVLIGKRDEYDFVFVHLLLQSPVGVPLFATGLAFYGLEALYARHLEPDKSPEERWFRDWYLRREVGPVDTHKWTDRRNSQAFGAGVILGTTFDGGSTLATKGLLIVVVPGPILLLDTRANLLRDPTALTRPDTQALFTALVVFDGRNGTLEIGLEPHYLIPDSGILVAIEGIAEGFFSFNDPRSWYLYLGRREREKRIRALVLKLFEANAYLMIDPDAIELGAFIGYDASVDAGPVRVALHAFIEGSAGVSRRPGQFKGDLHMDAGLEFSVAGIGFGLGIEAALKAQAPQPFEVEARLAAHVGLPFPIPDLDLEVTLRWHDPGPPRVIAPLHSVSVEHFPSGASWILGGEGQPPVVPLDGRLALVFERAVQDLTGRGLAAGDGEDMPMGDYTLRASLTDLVLEVGDGAGGWQPYQSVDENGNPVPFVGAWQPELGDRSKRNRRLLLWVRTPLVWSRSLSDSAVAQLAEADLSSFCEPEADARVIDFDAHPNAFLGSLQTFTYAGVDWTLGPAGGRVLEREAASADRPVNGTIPRPPYRCLLLPDQTSVGLYSVGDHQLPATGLETQPPAPEELALQMTFATEQSGIAVLVLSIGAWSLEAFDANGSSVGRAQSPAPPALSPPPDPRPFYVTELSIRARGIRRVVVDCVEPLAILTVVLHIPPGLDDQRTYHEAIEALQERFESTEPVLQPNRDYRLTVTTRVEDIGGRALNDAQVEGAAEREIQRNGSVVTIARSFLFRTQGPPGAADLGDTPDARADLNTLAVYVEWTLPDRGATHAYRNYDLGVAFNVNYLEQMYRSANQGLEIHLQSDQGEALALTNELGRGTELVLRREERLWLEMLGRYCGLTIPLDSFVRNTVVRARVTHSLAPGRRHEMMLAANPAGPRELNTPLYGLSFVSSAYLDFADHFRLRGRVRARPVDSGAWAAWRDLAASALAAGNPYAVTGDERTRRREVEVASFDGLFSLVQADRALPQDVELSSAGPDIRTWGMLLESPEPFEWERIQLSMTVVRALVGPAVDITTVDTLTGLISDGLIVREASVGMRANRDIDLSGWRVEARVRVPGSERYVVREYRFPPGSVYARDEAITVRARAEGELRQSFWRSLVTRILGIFGLSLRVGADVRLIDPFGQVTRTPLPELRMPEPVNFHVVRDADGTRAMLLYLGPNGVGPFPAGGYRLAATFRRDAGAELPVLSEQGSTQDEHARLAWTLPV